MSFLITAHARAQLPQSELARVVAQRTGQTPRRASPLASLALLACRDVLAAQEQATEPKAAQAQPLAATGPTALIWHSPQGPQPETEGLLAAQQTGDGLLLPFDFLASQPGLLCVQLQTWLPGLAQTLFLPGTAHPHEQAWMQMLQFAHFALAQKRFGRVICAALAREGGICRYAAISLVTDLLTGVSGASVASGAGAVAAPGETKDGTAHRSLLRGCWLPQSGQQPPACIAPAAVQVAAHQADAALWRWLESGRAARDAEAAVLLPAAGAALYLHRLPA